MRKKKAGKREKCTGLRKKVVLAKAVCYTDRHIAYKQAEKGAGMDLREELISLRESTGMNKKNFSEYFGIPYRTFQDWELGNRRVPEYLLRLMEYKVKMENLERK